MNTKSLAHISVFLIVFLIVPFKTIYPYLYQGNIEVSPDSINFGYISVGDTISREITIKNTGIDSLIIFKVYFSYDVFFTSFTQTKINPDDSIIVKVYFSPGNIKQYNDSLTIESSDTLRRKVIIPVKGTGIAPLDPYEPNNFRFKAWGPIHLNSSIYAYINPQGDEDWFYIDLDIEKNDKNKLNKSFITGNLKVILDSLPKDYDLDLYDNLGKKVAYSANQGTEPETTSVFVSKGKYFIKVYGFLNEFDPLNPYRLTTLIEKVELPEPQNLKAGSGYNKLIPLHWTGNYSKDFGTFTLERRKSSDTSYTIISDNITRYDYVDTTVSPYTSYTYRLKAVFSTGEESKYSNESTAQASNQYIELNIPATNNIPTIDGALYENEWKDAIQIDITNYSGIFSEPPPKKVTMLLKNNNYNLFIGVDDPNSPALTFQNELNFFFDENNNHIWDIAPVSIQPDFIFPEEGIIIVDKGGTVPNTVVRFRGITGTYPNNLTSYPYENLNFLKAEISDKAGHVQYELSINFSRSSISPLNSYPGNTLGFMIMSTIISETFTFTSYYPNDAVFSAPITFIKAHLSDSLIIPEITQISDIPDDQGGNVRITWKASPEDSKNKSPFNITNYGIWRKIKKQQLNKIELRKSIITKNFSKAIKKSSLNKNLYVDFDGSLWDGIGIIPAIQSKNYNAVSPTLVDSGKNDDYFTSFIITAHTYNPSVYFISKIDSGYSVDNLKPSIPSGFKYADSSGVIIIKWNKNPEKDVYYYLIYRAKKKNTPATDSTLVAKTTIPYFEDHNLEQGRAYYYKFAAVDYSGNKSGLSDELKIYLHRVPIIPEKFDLKQNFPNPFNKQTKITFFLPIKTKVIIKIFNVLGQDVYTLTDKTFPAGIHTIEWNATDRFGNELPSGIYIYKIRAGNFFKSKKLILLK